MQIEYEIKKEMCEIGRRVYNRGMVVNSTSDFTHIFFVFVLELNFFSSLEESQNFLFFVV